MPVLFVLGLGIWLLGHGLDAPVQRVAFITGAVLVLLSPFIAL